MPTIASIPTTYRGVNMRSRLEARYAALFDLLHWKWEYEPIDFNGWIPDFYIELPDCPRDGAACSRIDKLYAEIKPIRRIEDFNDPMVTRCVGWHDFHSPAIAIFGINPRVSQWSTLTCGGDSAGESGIELTHNLRDRPYRYLDDLWVEAGNTVQWKSPHRR